VVRSTGTSGTIQPAGALCAFAGQYAVTGSGVAPLTLNLTTALTVDVQLNPSASGNAFTLQSLVILAYPVVAATF
jgi:hypothetical protein